MSPKKKDSYDEGYDDASDKYYNPVRYKNDSDYRKGNDMRDFEMKREASQKEQDERDASRFSNSFDYSNPSDNLTSNYVNTNSSSDNNTGTSGIYKGFTIFIGAVLTVAALAILTIAAGAGYFFVFAFLSGGILFLVIGFRMD